MNSMRRTRVVVVAVSTLVTISTVALARSTIAVQSDVLRTGRGATVRFETGGSGTAPALVRMTISRSSAFKVAAPKPGRLLGRLVFFMRDNRPSNMRTVTMRHVRATTEGTLIGRGAGATIVLDSRLSRFLIVTLPAGAINPVISFSGSGARLFGFHCRSTEFIGSITRGSGVTTVNGTVVSAVRQRRAGLC
jgi:hypothetical protein